MSFFRRKTESLPDSVRIQEINEQHELAQRIFFTREERGWTQEELADRAGLTQSQVAKLEAGQTNPTLRTIVKVGHALDMRVASLFIPTGSHAFEWLESPSSGVMNAVEFEEPLISHLYEAETDWTTYNVTFTRAANDLYILLGDSEEVVLENDLRGETTGEFSAEEDEPGENDEEQALQVITAGAA